MENKQSDMEYLKRSLERESFQNEPLAYAILTYLAEDDIEVFSKIMDKLGIVMDVNIRGRINNLIEEDARNAAIAEECGVDL